ncbi:MAG: winged helix-turn-helix domain-containing protein, partial [Pseudomonadota bacterium]
MPGQTKRILVVAEQAALCAEVVRLARPLGYCVEVASTAKLARQLIGKERFATAVVAVAGLAGCEPSFLDTMCDAVQKLVLFADGANDVKRLSASFPDALVCTAQPVEEDKLLAFLGRPEMPQASVEEGAGVAKILHFASCAFDAAGRVFLNAERHEAALTPREFALLAVFARNPGRLLSRTQLRNAIDGQCCGSVEPFDRSVDMLVARLRRKIEPDAATPQFIVTVPSAGYKFVPSVCCNAPAAVPPVFSHQVPDARQTPRVERRQLAVLAGQIVGFAALAARLNPEDLGNAIAPVCAACAAVIARFGGTTVRTFGDSVLAYFGQPKSHENAAENAVRAALELTRAVRAINAAPLGSFRARIGVATGLMLIGAAGAGGEFTLVGEPLNLAQHMRTAAAADSVVIEPRTRRL